MTPLLQYESGLRIALGHDPLELELRLFSEVEILALEKNLIFVFQRINKTRFSTFRVWFGLGVTS